MAILKADTTIGGRKILEELDAGAIKLKLIRTIQTNLASTTAVGFDGTANIKPGVTGTLPIANGGTGATTAAAALTALGALPVAGGTITGNLRLKGSGNYGNKINFGDSEYVYLHEVSDDKLEIKASNLNFLVSGAITKNGTAFGDGGGLRCTTGSVSANGETTINLGWQPQLVICTLTNMSMNGVQTNGVAILTPNQSYNCYMGNTTSYGVMITSTGFKLPSWNVSSGGAALKYYTAFR